MSDEIEDSVDTGDVGDSSSEVSSPQGVESQGSHTQQAAPTQEQTNYYAAFKGIPQFQGMDDQQIVGRLYETMQREQAQARALQQYQQLIPVASEYMSNREAFQKWKEAQQAPQQAAPRAAEPAKPTWWSPPQVKDQYRQFLTRDAEGREIISEHAPLEAKAQLSELLNYRADFARKFLDDPASTLGPMVEEIAEQRAAKLVEGQITRQQQEQFVRNIEEENKAWLYDDPVNRVASREGAIVQKYIEDVKSLGVTDPEARWNLSVAMLERDLALQVLQQMQQPQVAQPQPQFQQPPAQPPAVDQAQKNMEFLRHQAARTAPRNSPATTDSRVPKKPATFAEKLRAALSTPGMELAE
jgi:hypothetical protein